MTQPGAKPGTAPMGPAPIDRKVEVAPGAFVPTQAAQQANRAFYLMHTRQFDEALKAYKGAMQYEEEKYKPVYDRVNSFFEKVRSSSDKGKAFSEVEETVLSEDPVPVKVKDYYVWRKLQPGRPQQVQQRPQGQPGYMMMPPGGIMPSGSMTNRQPSGAYVASRESDVFHNPTCQHVNQILEQNRVYYGTRQQAINAGKRPCKTCNP